MSSQAPSPFGIIGLGIIGSRIAKHLRSQGITVHTCNRSRKEDPGFVSSPQEVAEKSKTIQLFVRNGEDTLEIIASIADTLTPEHLILSHATIPPNDARQAAQAVTTAGARFLEAPFTGSKLAAQEGQLVYYVAGEPSTVDFARPFLEQSSKNILTAGNSIGNAAVIKIATNMVTGTTVAILAEALTLCQKNDINPDLLADAFKTNACHSTLIDMKLPSMSKGDFDPHFSLRNMFKDAQFGLNMGSETQTDLPVLSTVAATMFTAMRNGYDEEDFSVLLKNYKSASPSTAKESLPSAQPPSTAPAKSSPHTLAPPSASTPAPATSPSPKTPDLDDPLDSILAPPEIQKSSRPKEEPAIETADPPTLQPPPQAAAAKETQTASKPLAAKKSILPPKRDASVPPASLSERDKSSPVSTNPPPSSPLPSSTNSDPPLPAPPESKPEAKPQKENQAESKWEPDPEPELSAPEPAPQPKPAPAKPKRKSRFSFGFKSKEKNEPAEHRHPEPKAEPNIKAPPKTESDPEDPY
ncbi:MAG: NAD(P)-binding domain-containing protein [Verrucomicrobiota bacterium]